ncbi:response regulator transcription factor [Paenibacillus silviterrae]|uniref:response regulator transcription factor n=1 Tax=Paenibacillus silviterrae TaxID=3242194 RepID=UPI002542AB9B|nr:response regulator [Paenibacillus chinjuensis]
MYKIMIVDDEPIIRSGLQKLVEQSGIPIAGIRTATNGVQALEIIAEEAPDFLFTDIRMPKMDGLELCRSLYEMNADIHIVVISGYSDFTYAQKCVSFGVKEYLLKPVNKKKIQDVLEKLVRLKQKAESFVTVTQLEAWVAELEEAVWTLNESQLTSILGGIRQDLKALDLKMNRYRELLEEMYAHLTKTFNARDVFNLKASLMLSSSSDEEEVWQSFAQSIHGRLEELRVKRRGKAKDPVEEAKRYIDEHLAEEVSLEEVAERIGLNASYFSQLFKQSTQETFVQYRTRARMEKAKKLLQQPQYRITDISGEVGYADHPHFTKTFKKYTGCLPSEYRQRLGIE